MASSWNAHGSILIPSGGAAVGIVGKPKMVYGIHFISGAGGVGLVFLLNNGLGGTTYMQFSGTASKGTNVSFDRGFFFPTDCYCFTDGNVVSVLVSYDEI